MISIVRIRIAKIGYFVISVLLCALGSVLILYPELSAALLCRSLGVLLGVYGVIKLIGYFSKDLYRLAFQFDLAGGILFVVLGIILAVRPYSTLSILFPLTGVLILADGLLKIQISMDARAFGLRNWWLILAFAILAGFFGLLLIVQPEKFGNFAVILFGISLLADGLLGFCVALCAVKIIRNQKPDNLNTDTITLGKDDER